MRWNTCVGVAALLCASMFAQAEVSREKGEAFAKQVEMYVAERDGKAFSDCFDREAFLARVFRGVQHPGAAEAKAGMREGMAALGNQLTHSFHEPEDGAHFLHMRQVDGNQVLTYRISTAAGMNYWDLYIDDSSGPVKITDMHVALTGEDLSQSMQRLVLRMLSGSGDTLSKEDKQAAADFTALSAATREGRSEEALQIADRLPPKMQKEKFVQIMRIQAASALTDTTKADAICDEFRKTYGDDPACDLVMLDSHIRRNETVLAIACVDRLDKTVGGDAYLEVLRGNIYLLTQKDAAKAQQHYTQAQKRDADLFEAADAQLALALENADFDQVKKCLLVIENHPKWEFVFDADLGGADMYVAFKASPQYAAWLAERPKKE